jgi:hypothetical protein
LTNSTCTRDVISALACQFNFSDALHALPCNPCYANCHSVAGFMPKISTGVHARCMRSSRRRASGHHPKVVSTDLQLPHQQTAQYAARIMLVTLMVGVWPSVSVASALAFVSHALMNFRASTYSSLRHKHIHHVTLASVNTSRPYHWHLTGTFTTHLQLLTCPTTC